MNDPSGHTDYSITPSLHAAKILIPELRKQNLEGRDSQRRCSRAKGCSSIRERRVCPRLVLLACCAVLFIASMNAALTNVALPSIREGLGASAPQLQWIVDAYTLILGTFLLASGVFADRFGRKLAFIIGPSIFAIASAFCALSPSVSWLIIGRGLQAVGGALLTPVALSIISATYTDAAERARAIGI